LLTAFELIELPTFLARYEFSGSYSAVCSVNITVSLVPALWSNTH